LYFLPLPQGHVWFRPIFATKFIFAATLSDVSWMSLEELRACWERALAHRGHCKRCNGARIWHIGTRVRKASILLEDKIEFVPDVPERRLECGDCELKWTQPPDRISSRAHYQPCVVAHALAMMEAESEMTAVEIAGAPGCHPRTLGRWVNRVADIADPRDLGAAIVAQADAPVLPAIPTEVARPGGAHAHERLVCALAVLALLEALASLRGLEPPALAHAAELIATIPANAPGPRSRGDPRSHV
jgi:hypothetical protein